MTQDRPDLETSLAKLQQALEQGPEVERMSRRLVEEAKANHLANMIVLAMTPRRTS